MTNHLPGFVVIYVGSRPMTDGIASKRFFNSEFIVSSVILRMVTMLI